jgi:hypothetical protein
MEKGYNEFIYGRDKEDIHGWCKAKVKIMCGNGISVVKHKVST